MVFNSILFIFVFLPLALLGFRLSARLGHQAAVAWLVGVSLLFYGWWAPQYLILLCGSMVFNYGAGLLIQRTSTQVRRQQVVLFLAVVSNIALLGYFKYLFPLLSWVEHLGIHLGPVPNSILLPLGISFFTFTQIGYLIDCKAGLTSNCGFLNYCLFVTFFPHLIAGPILHHKEMVPQFADKKLGDFRFDNLVVGLSIFFIGLAKKDFIADSFAPQVANGFDHAGKISTAQAWCSLLSYSIQLYFDFSGYSEMAVGLARMFNVRMPANFDSPYKAASIIDYWQRFHMTLTRYVNLYLYNPIALDITRRRAAKRLPVGRPGLKTWGGFLGMVAIPTFCTMTLAGIWHGAGVNFVIFGLLHSFYLTVNHAWRLLFHKKNAPVPSAPVRWLRTTWKVLLTFLAMLFAQLFFRAASFSDALAMLHNLVGLHYEPLATKTAEPAFRPLFAAFAIVWLCPNVLQVFAPWEPTLSKPHASVSPWLQWKPNLVWACVIGVIATLAILSIAGQTEFLYFRF